MKQMGFNLEEAKTTEVKTIEPKATEPKKITANDVAKEPVNEPANKILNKELNNSESPTSLSTSEPIKKPTKKPAKKPTNKKQKEAKEIIQPAQEPTEEEPHIYSVTELNQNIRQTLEGKFALLWIQGEISNFKAHTSGHFYFSLKDKKSQINAVMFRGFNQRLKFKPQDGQEVLIRARVTVYEPRGNYQIFCEVMEPVGAGALQIAYEQLKKKLQDEGLFSPQRKRPLPALPKHIALVTSPTGAAVRDMLNVLSRRFKGVNIIIIPVLVQGEKAAPSIVEGIQNANRLTDVDVLIVGRGGGSIEDLWAFNEEIVARAIVHSQKPVISAVGHEVDFTIADFVADLRAPTPSVAAELVIQNAEELIHRIDIQKRRLWTLYQAIFKAKIQKLENLKKRLVDPRRRLQDLIIRCDELTQRLESSALRYLDYLRTQVKLITQKLGDPKERLSQSRQKIIYLQDQLKANLKFFLEVKRSQLNKNMVLLDSLSPLRVVDRGYSIVTKDGKVVKSTQKLVTGDKIHLRFAEGEADATIESLK